MFEYIACYIDVIENHNPYNLKEDWNAVIDDRLFNKLELKDGQKMTAIEFCYIIQNQLKKH